MTVFHFVFPYVLITFVPFQAKFDKKGILIIDEKSMIGHSMFINIDKRLREARPNFRDQYFGGLSIILLGDWKQLPPVCDTALFNTKNRKKGEPKPDQTGHNLYLQFKKSIVFDRIQRQDGDDQKDFREELTRLGNGEFTEQDWRKWQERDLEKLPQSEQAEFLDNAILACARKKDSVEHNIAKVRATGQPIAPIYAENSPKAKNLPSDQAGNLLPNIILSKDTVFRLTSNLWTEAGLTNGAVGKVHSIMYKEGTKPPALPFAIIGIFEEYLGPPFLDDVPKSVPITPVKRDFVINKKPHWRKMLPVILGYALSVHKLQGATCDRVILNAGDQEFSLGLTLVGASRTK